MPYLTSYLCVCVFVGFLLNLALAELGGGREGVGSRRAERLSEAERGGPGGQGGPLTAEGAGELGSWGRRQPRLQCHPTGIRGEAVQGSRRGATGTQLPPQNTAAMASMGLPTVPAPTPGPRPVTRTGQAQRKGRGPKAATGQAQEGKTGADSCPRAGHGSGSEETSQPRVFLFIWLVFIT